MAENKIIEDGDGEGQDWRTDAAASLERDDPEKAKRRGRPKGAINRKTADFADWYREQGFKDPLVAQAQFMSADPVALQSWFVEHERTFKPLGKQIGKAVPALIDIVGEQMKCARDLAPYLHGKMPTKIDLGDQSLPALIMNLGTNQLAQAIEIGRLKTLSIGTAIDITPNENKDLAK